MSNAVLELLKQFSLDHKILKALTINSILNLILTMRIDCIYYVIVVSGMAEHKKVTAFCDPDIYTGKKKTKIVQTLKTQNISVHVFAIFPFQ